MSEATIQTQTYNGWTNRETWLGNLWLNNDEGMYDLLCRAIKENNTIWETAQYIEQELRWQLEDEIDTASIWQDLLGTAFDRIDWIAIVTSHVADQEV